jgi:hypothetical protein
MSLGKGRSPRISKQTAVLLSWPGWVPHIRLPPSPPADDLPSHRRQRSSLDAVTGKCRVDGRAGPWVTPGGSRSYKSTISRPREAEPRSRVPSPHGAPLLCYPVVANALVRLSPARRMQALAGAGHAGPPDRSGMRRPMRSRPTREYAEQQPDGRGHHVRCITSSSRLFVVVPSGPARRHRPRVRPIIDRVPGAEPCAPLAGSSVTGLVSDGAGREEM